MPSICLSFKAEEAARIAARDAGADDHVMKPFGMKELMARIGAAPSRTELGAADVS